ncbi:NADPH-dependent FMN reductase [Flexibacterium corallicola]|uniref:NADPH-dependent FMN reductase n=1 Tax=Flexibacterium corallicola TaxID=3037259 RepID=UPI00286F296B|nr:NAD(P)H-dependent oxidoreductase [Pseudovibrio sp. M1P-2-3]
MKLCIINGSHREKSQSSRITDYLSNMPAVLNAFGEVDRIELCSADIEIWNEGVWDGHSSWDGWFETSENLASSDAFIIVTPEWGGMVPPRLKNLLMLASVKETGHKPALIVSVSAGEGGFAPMTELRAFAYKNSHICYLPDHVILRNVESLFNGELNEDNDRLRDRLDYGIRMLAQYSAALLNVRNSGIVNDVEFKYGMS